MLFKPDPAKATNKIGHTFQHNYGSSNTTEIIVSKLRYIYGYSILSNTENSIYNNLEVIYNDTKNIRLTLTPQAIRNNKLNWYSGKFDNGYPQSANYSLCNQRLSSVFNYGNIFYTSFFTRGLEYPSYNTFGSVKDLKLTSNYCEGCSIDNITGLCTEPPVCVEESETITIPPNLKTTIKGYAFYVDTIRDVEVPNIGTRKTTCAGGHACCRTNFIPRIVTPNGMYSGDEFDMNNLGSCETQSIPVDNFIANTPYERSAHFTIDVPDINNVINSSLFLLACNSEEGCHSGVTMVFLVAEDASTDESYLIFASCVAVGCTDPVPLGKITNADANATDCVVDPLPVPKCDELRVKFSGCSFPTSGPYVNNPDSLALANYINSILSSIINVEVSFDSNGYYSNLTSGSSIVGSYGLVNYVLQITRTTSTAIAIAFSSANVINGTTTIFTADINVPNAPSNPYDLVSSTTSSFAGWFSQAVYGCNLTMTLNPII